MFYEGTPKSNANAPVDIKLKGYNILFILVHNKGLFSYIFGIKHFVIAGSNWSHDTNINRIFQAPQPNLTVAYVHDLIINLVCSSQDA